MSEMRDYGFETDGSIATTDAYADVPLLIQTSPGALHTRLHLITSGPISINWENTGANSINSKVLASNNPDAAAADRAEVVAEAAIVAGALRHITIDIAHYRYYWLQHQAAVGGSQGASQVWGRHIRV